ncbi:MAG: protein kinase [Polyangiaceae bacterium]|nr:protein kinase [Polyangiaceae bacterium]
MIPRPKIGSTEVGRLRNLVAEPSEDQTPPIEACSAPPASSLPQTWQSQLALPNALAVLLEGGPEATPAPSLLAPGATVGRYEIVRLLGAGGMGMVYEAIDPLLKRRIALKLLRNRRREDSERALGEARALAQITHQNVVTAFDVGQAEDLTYVAMELIAGASLRRQLGIWARPWAQLESVFLQVGHALEAAHAAGLVHCDVKPDNVLVDGRGYPYVADFGLARCFLPEGSSTDPVPETRGSMRWFGTPGYVAPELVAGHEPSPQTDQFSFCVMVVEALTGLPPDTDAGSPVPIREQLVARLERAVAPRYVKRALSRGLAPTPERRFSDMGALLGALASPPRRRALPVGVGLASIVLFGVGYGVVSNINPAEVQNRPFAVHSSIATSTPIPDRTPSRAPPQQSEDAEPVPPSRYPRPAPTVMRPVPSVRPAAPVAATPGQGPNSSHPVATPPDAADLGPTSVRSGAASATDHRPFGPRK